MKLLMTSQTGFGIAAATLRCAYRVKHSSMWVSPDVVTVHLEQIVDRTKTVAITFTLTDPRWQRLFAKFLKLLGLTGIEDTDEMNNKIIMLYDVPGPIMNKINDVSWSMLEE